MNLFTAMGAALEGLRTNMLRSLLTMPGVIIGIGAVIVMVALGQGAQAQGAPRSKAWAPTPWWSTPAWAAAPYAAPELPLTLAAATGNMTWTTAVTGTTPDLQVILGGIPLLHLPIGTRPPLLLIAKPT